MLNFLLELMKKEVVISFERVKRLETEMAENPRLQQLLASVSLQQYYSNFLEAGFDEARIASLTMQDYDRVGISTLQERKRLFTLIQQIRSKKSMPSGEKSSAPVAAQPEVRKEPPPEKKGIFSRLTKAKSRPVEPKPVITAPPTVSNQTNAPRIMVCVRKRPMSRKELESGQVDVTEVGNQNVVICQPKQNVDLTRYMDRSEFVFDTVFPPEADNDDIYEKCAQPLIDLVFGNGRATCFAYGQTGSGKTYTMLGDERNPDVEGIYVKAAKDIFRLTKSESYKHLAVWVSFYEIYGGKLYDLLNDRKLLYAREDAQHKVQIVGLQERCLDGSGGLQALVGLIAHGNDVRSTGSTGVNADSSRSHAILQICLKDRRSKKSRGQISFIDLAGSERAADTMSNDRQTRMEGAEINKSLLALKECIRALDQGHGHVPFRGSKLTQVLRDSFIGSNVRTVMIANVSPNSVACEHTLNTLRYANRVKELQKDPKARDGHKVDAYMPHMKPGGQVVPDSRDSQIDVTVEPPRARSPNPYVPKKPKKSTDRKTSKGHRRAASDQGFDEDSKKESSPDLGGPSAVPIPRKMVPNPPGGKPPRGKKPLQHQRGSSDQQINLMDSQELAIQHEELVTEILEEEESIILMHRQQIDDMMEFIKQEMDLLNDVDQPGASIDDYVTSLSVVLRKKQREITKLADRLGSFGGRLKDEETLSRSIKASSKGFLGL